VIGSSQDPAINVQLTCIKYMNFPRSSKNNDYKMALNIQLKNKLTEEKVHFFFRQNTLFCFFEVGNLKHSATFLLEMKHE